MGCCGGSRKKFKKILKGKRSPKIEMPKTPRQQRIEARKERIKIRQLRAKVRQARIALRNERKKRQAN